MGAALLPNLCLGEILKSTVPGGPRNRINLNLSGAAPLNCLTDSIINLTFKYIFFLKGEIL